VCCAHTPHMFIVPAYRFLTRLWLSVASFCLLWYRYYLRFTACNEVVKNDSHKSFIMKPTENMGVVQREIRLRWCRFYMKGVKCACIWVRSLELCCMIFTVAKSEHTDFSVAFSLGHVNGWTLYWMFIGSWPTLFVQICCGLFLVCTSILFPCPFCFVIATVVSG